jgi:hypothetical protein
MVTKTPSNSSKPSKMRSERRHRLVTEMLFESSKDLMMLNLTNFEKERSLGTRKPSMT